jgi:hypothetical protein
MRRPGERNDGGRPTAALVGAAGAAPAGIALAAVFWLLGAGGFGLVAGAGVALLAAAGYTWLRSDVRTDLALAVLATAAFYILLALVLLAVVGALVGRALTD